MLSFLIFFISVAWGFFDKSNGLIKRTLAFYIIHQIICGWILFLSPIYYWYSMSSFICGFGILSLELVGINIGYWFFKYVEYRQ